MTNFVVDYCNMAKIALTGYRLLADCLDQLPSQQKRAAVSAAIQPVLTIKSELERVEQQTVDLIQQHNTEIMEETHFFTQGVKEALDVSGLGDKELRSRVSELTHEVKDDLMNDEHESLRFITEVFKPVHELADRLIARLSA